MGENAETGRRTRAFASPWLERLSRIHPLVPLCVWAPLAVAAIVAGARAGLSAAAVAGWTAAGLLAWTLTEYVLHRWLFHFEPADPGLRDKLYPVHRLHHDVQEWDRLVAPLLMSVPLAAVFFGLFSLVVGWPSALPLFGGFVIGYLAYDYIHFYTHFGRPRTRIGRGLRRRHLQHHFACPDRWFGVSSPLWDYVFRTHVPRGSQARPRV
ncbi:MAG TPA: sterol desaturase family protein [Candidatus Polarisedimenticolaceae bacterium]|nr:sterol desaturase family protein [Candidatus Polarisedimenticolaceae bacterium]